MKLVLLFFVCLFYSPYATPETKTSAWKGGMVLHQRNSKHNRVSKHIETNERLVKRVTSNDSINSKNSIVVEAKGVSLGDALNNAFKVAIDNEVGLILDTERHMKNDEIVHSQILSYSAGYIKKYEILEHEHNREKNSHQIRINVIVASSKLRNYLLISDNDSKSFNIDEIKTRIKSLKKSKLDRETLVRNFFKTFPEGAFDIQVSDFIHKIDSQGKSSLNIPINISWNKEYIEALFELYTVISDSNYDTPKHRNGDSDFIRRGVSKGNFVFIDRVKKPKLLRRMNTNNYYDYAGNILNIKGFEITDKSLSYLLWDISTKMAKASLCVSIESLENGESERFCENTHDILQSGLISVGRHQYQSGFIFDPDTKRITEKLQIDESSLQKFEGSSEISAYIINCKEGRGRNHCSYF
jgi:hypothetical protein|tara:strand:- start:16 stop:1254 length:1239 start_codon:yes stop_codon:yes gene_type:complete